ncbi:MAG: molybdopterin molybdotransferase MoeA [Solirubrobacterales bacterium]|nr:molybdopterin molybdotransferase MoeA [Solirubrobacterales bacterium]
MPELTQIEDARRLVLSRVSAGQAEDVPLSEARGRTLAEDVRSEERVPGFDNSAMDGYAVQSADLAGASAPSPVELPIVDESRAGIPASRGPASGESVAISTGAMVPEGADAVVRIEDTERSGDRVSIAVEAEPGDNLRRAGDDIELGDVVLRAGSRVEAAELGIAASVGRPALSCARRPRVSVLATGDELRRPDEELPPGGVRNSNAFTLAALVADAGGEVIATDVIRDERGTTRDQLAEPLRGEITVICGGVSVGPHDHVRPALAELGVEQVFWGVALRPGKPTFFGVAPTGGLVFGLPGNPVSAMVTFTLFVRPAIRAMLGSPDPSRRTSAILDAGASGQPARTHAVRCGLRLADDGWHATPTGDQSSHVLSSMLGADALAILAPGAGTLAAGERVELELLPR